MHELMEVLELAATAVDIIGIIIVLYGFVLAFVQLMRTELGRLSGNFSGIVGCEKVRLMLGTYILLGIEFMIASDIINTVISKSIESLIFVAALVVIRTAISFFLGRELAELGADKS